MEECSICEKYRTEEVLLYVKKPQLYICIDCVDKMKKLLDENDEKGSVVIPLEVENE